MSQVLILDIFLVAYIHGFKDLRFLNSRNLMGILLLQFGRDDRRRCRIWGFWRGNKISVISKMHLIYGQAILPVKFMIINVNFREWHIFLVLSCRLNFDTKHALGVEFSTSFAEVQIRRCIHKQRILYAILRAHRRLWCVSLHILHIMRGCELLSTIGSIATLIVEVIVTTDLYVHIVLNLGQIDWMYI